MKESVSPKFPVQLSTTPRSLIFTFSSRNAPKSNISAKRYLKSYPSPRQELSFLLFSRLSTGPTGSILSTNPTSNTFTNDSEVYQGKHLSDGDSVLIEMEDSNPLDPCLPVLGFSPAMVFCRYCKQEVHTSIQLSSLAIPRGILKVISKISSCCNGLNWLKQVHTCPNCRLVIAKCR